MLSRRALTVILTSFLLGACQPENSAQSPASKSVEPPLPLPSINSKVLTLVSDPWPGYVETSGGYLVTLARKIFEPLGFKLQVRLLPFARALNEVQLGEADMAPALYWNTARQITYAQAPTAVDATGVLYNTQNFDSALTSNLLQLNHKKVVWVRDFDFSPILKQRYHLELQGVETNSRENGLLMLKNGRVDAMIDNYQLLATLAPQFNLKTPQYRLMIAFQKGLYFGFTDNARGHKLKTFFDEGIANMVRTGELQRLYQSSVPHGPELLIP